MLERHEGAYIIRISEVALTAFVPSRNCLSFYIGLCWFSLLDVYKTDAMNSMSDLRGMRSANEAPYVACGTASHRGHGEENRGYEVVQLKPQ